MKVTTITREEYEDCELIAQLGDWLLFRCPAEDEADPPLEFALPVRIVYSIDFEKPEEVERFTAAYPFGKVLP